jgi:hypothetical protein
VDQELELVRDPGLAGELEQVGEPDLDPESMV